MCDRRLGARSGSQAVAGEFGLLRGFCWIRVCRSLVGCVDQQSKTWATGDSWMAATAADACDVVRRPAGRAGHAQYGAVGKPHAACHRSDFLFSPGSCGCLCASVCGSRGHPRHSKVFVVLRRGLARVAFERICRNQRRQLAHVGRGRRRTNYL